MPIEVEGPDGSIVEFPDGTSQDVMSAAMRTHYANMQSKQDAKAAGGDTFWGNIAKGYWPTSEQASNLASDAAQRMKTGIKETAASVPVLGRLVPRDPAMEKYEQDNPGVTAINKIGGGVAATIPFAAASPAAVFEGPAALRLGAGMATNAGVNAADTAAGGGSWDDVKRAANVGAMTGAIPYVGAKIVNPGMGAQTAARVGDIASRGLFGTMGYGASHAMGLPGEPGALMGLLIGENTLSPAVRAYLTGNTAIARALMSPTAKSAAPAVSGATQALAQELTKRGYGDVHVPPWLNSQF